MFRKSVLMCCLLLMICPGLSSGDFKLAVYPSNDPEKLIIPMKIMAQYLTEQSGEPFTAVVTSDYAELSERLENQTVRIAWINPVNYIKMKKEHPSLRYIATYMEKNEVTGEITPFYTSYIIALKSSGINEIIEGQHLRFAFTDPGSTSGYAFPNLMLRKMGIIPDQFFKKVFFLKKHDRVIQALMAGSIDIGAVSDGTYYTAARKYGDLFTIIKKSDPIPLDAIVAPENVAPEKVRRYQEILTRVPENHPFNLAMREHLGWHAAGFEVKDDRFYNAMRDALK